MNETKKSVLLIEDDLGDAVLVERSLSHCADNLDLVIKSTLSEAVTELSQRTFDVILLDLSLPDSVGIEGIAKISEKFRQTPVVVLTGLADNLLAEEALERGAQDYLVKGHTSGEQLERTLRHAIQRHQIQSENTQLLGELERMAHYDALTGLLNRHSFNEELEREWSRAGRSGTPLTCVMLDADYFKRVNDTFGHAAGDHVLQHLADVLRRSSRISDRIARYGGEEFCVLLPESNERNAAAWADRVRKRIEEEPIVFDGKEIRVTASFGVSQRLRDTGGTAELVGRADKALLVAKQLGRNQVVTFGQMNSLLDSDTLTAKRRFGETFAKDVMVPVVLKIRETYSVPQAVEMLLRTRLESLPVVDENGTLLGLIAEEDLTTRLLARDDWASTVDEIANRRTVCFRENTPIHEVCEFLQRAAVRRVVVVDDEQRPCGTISRGTILRWLRNLACIDESLRQLWAEEVSSVPKASEQLTETLGRIADQLDQLRSNPITASDNPLASVIGGISQIQEVLDDALSQASSHQGDAESTCGTAADFWA